MDLFATDDVALAATLAQSLRKGLPEINIRADEGKFLQVLVCACQARIVLEIGTLGGYSGIWIARGLQSGGKLITLEKDSDHAKIALENFKKAGVSDRVEIKIGDAHDLLEEMEDKYCFDFIFIDAEKSGYEYYLDWALRNIRIGGIITAHNTLRGGRVADRGDNDENVVFMRKFNSLIANNEKLTSTIFPAGDGILFAVKIS